MNMQSKQKSLIMGSADNLGRTLLGKAGDLVLFLTAALPCLSVVFIFIFIIGEALPFFDNLAYLKEFFTSFNWTPSKEVDPHFGALSIIYGTAMVSFGSCLIAVPIGLFASICLSEFAPNKIRKIFKPVIEVLAAIPSVVFGFFAIIILAPLLQDHSNILLFWVPLLVLLPMFFIVSLILSKAVTIKTTEEKRKRNSTIALIGFFAVFVVISVIFSNYFSQKQILSGTNALNVSFVLAIMALPTIISLSEDSISSVSKAIKEGSLALGATKTESIFKIILPAAKSGILAAIILGLMRVIGETMVVWMASGNSIKLPEPFYNYFEPIRTLTATIAGEMGEADQTTGSARYHVLFAMSLLLLISSFVLNLISQKFSKKSIN